MMDFIYSKFAMLVAVAIITASMIGFFYLQQSNIELRETQDVADNIANRVNEFGHLNANTKFNFTFNSSSNGIQQNGVINGTPYTLFFTQNFVCVSTQKNNVSSRFLYQVHLWNPQRYVYNTTELANMDFSHQSLQFASGNDFIIERRLVDVSEKPEYHTFIYKH